MKYNFALLTVLLLSGCGADVTSKGELQQIATDFNKKGPRMIDSETKIDAIEIKGANTIVYKYTLVNLLAHNVDTNEFKKALKPGIISIIKLSPEMKKLREMETSFEYHYSDKQNKFIYNFKILPVDYK